LNQQSSRVVNGKGQRTWLSDVRSLGVLGRAWTVGVFLFSAARALIAWPALGRYGVNPWIFLAIDIATAAPYGLSQALTVKILRDRDRKPTDSLGWGAVVVVTFLMPYAYIFLASGSMSMVATAGVIAWMAVFGLLAAYRMRRQVNDNVESRESQGEATRS